MEDQYRTVWYSTVISLVTITRSILMFFSGMGKGKKGRLPYIMIMGISYFPTAESESCNLYSKRGYIFVIVLIARQHAILGLSLHFSKLCA